jgi:hypothetical protein
MNIPIKKSRGKSQIKNDFSMDEDELIDVSGFSEGEAKIEGTLLKSFSFDSDDELVEVVINSTNTSIDNIDSLNITEDSNKPITQTNVTNNKNSISSSDKNNIQDHRTLKANPNGRTPPVDGEVYDMVRTYTLRRSTVRILSKIKAIHSDDNVYLNTIVDEAIRYYYEYLKNINN